MRRLPVVLLLILAALALVAAGCGSDDDDSSAPAAVSTTATTDADESEEAEEDEESATPEEAVEEIAAIRTLLGDAVTQVEAGDREQAEETVGDAYLEHFEHVEHPLGERDHDLMEELEVAISTDLRNQIKDGDDAAVIRSSVDEIDAKLDQAVEALQG
jgi:hypothetical protein